jgi:peroxiredoxin Q/BCP
LARLRNDYEKFEQRGVQILAIGPNIESVFQQYWANEKIPYVGLPDPEHRVAALYRQQVNLFKLGRMPLMCVVDKNGRIRYAHYGASMSDIPETATLLNVIDQLAASSNQLPITNY